MLCVAYLTLAERKIIGYMQVRIGPNRVGPLGLLQPIADGVKLLLQGGHRSLGCEQGLFILGPILPSRRARGLGGRAVLRTAWCWPTSMPGLLFLLAITSLGVA